MSDLSVSISSSNSTRDDLLINYDDGTVGFTVISEKAGQLDFVIDIEDWKVLDSFIKHSWSKD